MTHSTAQLAQATSFNSVSLACLPLPSTGENLNLAALALIDHLQTPHDQNTQAQNANVLLLELDDQHFLPGQAVSLPLRTGTQVTSYLIGANLFSEITTYPSGLEELLLISDLEARCFTNTGNAYAYAALLLIGEVESGELYWFRGLPSLQGVQSWITRTLNTLKIQGDVDAMAQSAFSQLKERDTPILSFTDKERPVSIILVEAKTLSAWQPGLPS